MSSAYVSNVSAARANASIVLCSLDDASFGDFLDKMLALDPKKRLSAEDALDHDWFWSDPLPTEPSR